MQIIAGIKGGKSMANNIKNLIPNSERSPQELKEMTRKGGIASGKARRRKKELREALEMLLEKDFTNEQGEKMQGIDVIATALFKEASKGNVKAFNSLRDTIGQMPVQKIQVAEIDQSVVEEVEMLVNEQKNN